MSSTTDPTVFYQRDAIRDAVRAAQAAGQTVGVVMTMGALHEGHLSLVRESVATCDMTVVTIFVNPTQFLPNEDFDSYPRQLATDLASLANLSVEMVFAPSREEMYGTHPGGSALTTVTPSGIAQRWEGQCRPGHYQGVATVVLKLLHIVPGDFAFFGQKDYQQSLVIRHLVRDLDLPVTIRTCPTVRESDGLAMSSRNAFLDTEERQQAAAISRALKMVQSMTQEGASSAAELAAKIRRELVKSGIQRIDYVAIVARDSLEEIDSLQQPAIALVAAHVGETRLIDNWPLGPSLKGPDE